MEEMVGILLGVVAGFVVGFMLRMIMDQQSKIKKLEKS